MIVVDMFSLIYDVILDSGSPKNLTRYMILNNFHILKASNQLLFILFSLLNGLTDFKNKDGFTSNTLFQFSFFFFMLDFSEHIFADILLNAKAYWNF